jgi:hypothetical protein
MEPSRSPRTKLTPTLDHTQGPFGKRRDTLSEHYPEPPQSTASTGDRLLRWVVYMCSIIVDAVLQVCTSCLPHCDATQDSSRCLTLRGCWRCWVAETCIHVNGVSPCVPALPGG